jgi:hypothetical protein
MKRFHLLVVMLLVSTASAADRAGQSPYLRPEFQALMDAVTFHLSFDRGSMTPDLAEGDVYQPQTIRGGKSQASPQFAPGLLGQALVLGSGMAVYPRPGNVLLENRGAIAFWIKPQGWQRRNDDNIVFTMTTNASFYVERQGPLYDEQGRARRHESVLYLVRDEGRRLLSLADGSPWENGRWYLVVVNWSWPTFEMSVNGQPFSGRGLSAVPGPKTFGALIVGDCNGPRGLLDEFMAFRRPLTLTEAQLLWGLAGNSSSQK